MFKTAKTKLLALGAVTLTAASSAMADITVAQDGAISGSLNVGPFMSGAGVIIVALGAMWAIKKVISLLR